MIRSIKQRIYFVGLVPLAALAVALLTFNGVARIKEAHAELRNAQNVAAALLQAPAGDALLLGNKLDFERTVRSVLQASPLLNCVILRDADRREVLHLGPCSDHFTRADYFRVTVLAGGFSDFRETPNATIALGDLGLVMNTADVAVKRRDVILQLLVSLSLIAAVIGLIGALLRVRLIEPIQRIGQVMKSVSQRDYSARVSVTGEDELARLADAVNSTISTIDSYTRELERRRSEADHALDDADEANLARAGLVRSLTEDLTQPLNQMHAELTQMAMVNTDATLRRRIREVLRLVQTAQSNFEDLMEIASSVQSTRQLPMRQLADVLNDVKRDSLLASEAIAVPLDFRVVQHANQTPAPKPTGTLVDIDAVRLTRALVYLIRTIGRRCREPGIFLTMELLPVSSSQLHVSVRLKAFLKPFSGPSSGQRAVDIDENLQTIIGWTDREQRIIDYLLRVLAITPSFSVSPSGVLSANLETSCRYTSEGAVHEGDSSGRFVDKQPIVATMVSDDASLTRFASRSDLSNVELRLLSFRSAFEDPSSLRREAVLLVDMTDDIVDAIRLVGEIGPLTPAGPYLVAICPPGRIFDSLDERLLDLGFRGVIQKPLHHGRIIAIVLAAVSQRLQDVQAGTRNQ